MLVISTVFGPNIFRYKNGITGIFFGYIAQKLLLDIGSK